MRYHGGAPTAHASLLPPGGTIRALNEWLQTAKLPLKGVGGSVKEPSCNQLNSSLLGTFGLMHLRTPCRPKMDKTAVFDAIRKTLFQEFEHLRALSKNTRSAGADAESRAEGKYDTRSTEQNYLADGQARQAHVAAQALAAFDSLGVRSFLADAPIELGALIELEFSAGDRGWFLLGPAAGGREVEVDGTAVTVITPESPLGRQLLGLTCGGSTGSPKATVRAVS